MWIKTSYQFRRVISLAYWQKTIWCTRKTWDLKIQYTWGEIVIPLCPFGRGSTLHQGHWRFFKKASKYGKKTSRFYLGDSRHSKMASKHADQKTLKDELDCRQNRKVPTDTLVRMAEFLLTNNYFDFGKKYSIKFLEPLLTRNLHHLIQAILWITLRWIFLKWRSCSDLFCLGIQMMHSLYGLIINWNLKVSCNN